MFLSSMVLCITRIISELIICMIECPVNSNLDRISKTCECKDGYSLVEVYFSYPKDKNHFYASMIRYKINVGFNIDVNIYVGVMCRR